MQIIVRFSRTFAELPADASTSYDDVCRLVEDTWTQFKAASYQLLYDSRPITRVSSQWAWGGGGAAQLAHVPRLAVTRFKCESHSAPSCSKS